MSPMAYDYSTRAAVITGGARGIGRGIGERLARAGARVVVWDLDPGHFDTERDDYRPAALIDVDVADPTSVEAAFAQTLNVVGDVDILVNNAGINGPVTPVWELDTDAWQQVLAVNLTGVFTTCRAVVPHMRHRGHGRIVDIASVAGKEGNALQSAYSASKAGVIALTKTLAEQLATDGITVNAVAPAFSETDLMAQMTTEHIAAANAKIPMGRPVDISEIANLVAWIVSDECTFTTGFTFDITGGRATY